MDGIDKIIERIAADAEAEAKALRDGAEKEVEERRRAALSAMEKETKAILAEGQRKADAYEARLVDTARLEERKKRLAVKQELVEKAFQRALMQFAAMPEEEYAEFLSRLCCEAAVSGKEQVLLSPKDREKYGQRVVDAANGLLKEAGKTAELTLSGVSREMAGGVVLKEGDIETNGSLEALLQQNRDTAAADVAAVLFR